MNTELRSSDQEAKKKKKKKKKKKYQMLMRHLMNKSWIIPLKVAILQIVTIEIIYLALI